jgi:peptidyl-tRNA hydrolase
VQFAESGARGHSGLKLISQNTGQREFLVGVDAVEEPDRVLSDWVVASYRGAANGG